MSWSGAIIYRGIAKKPLAPTGVTTHSVTNIFEKYNKIYSGGQKVTEAQWTLGEAEPWLSPA